MTLSLDASTPAPTPVDGDPSDTGGVAVTSPPVPADGLELLGRLDGSGYREPPWLVRRADGQLLQVTPVLHAVLEGIDGDRSTAQIAEWLEDQRGLAIDSEDIGFLIEERLRPLGVLRAADGSEPAVRRSQPLLGLRGRIRMVSPARSDAAARALAPLFSPLVVVIGVLLFILSSSWLFATEDLGSATRELFHQPGALLAVLALTIVSAGFHELGHAAACQYGGAKPGVMGAGLYLVWPAFYTDVTNSYRLGRGGRLRVDLGGLYFNALFLAGSFGAWVTLHWNPLLILMVFQLLQMLQQLTPLVRFDGYHVLADLVGVPDLFARVRPVLLSLLPWRWGRREAAVLRPWARAVITAWVLVVVPVLGLSLLMMVLSFPRLAATAFDSLRNQADVLAAHWADADVAATVLSAVGMLTIALPVASATYLISRLVRRAGRRAWGATEGHPPARRALVVAALALVVAVAAAWWPQGQYRPIAAGERLTLPGLGSLSDAGPDRTGGGGERSDPDRLGGASAAESRARHGVAVATGASATAGPAGGYVFDRPASPRAQDNQALAIGYDPGATKTDVATSLDWAEVGDVDHRNQAFALASCLDCRTSAVAFQVVLVVGQHDLVAPRNEAVAKNVQCVRCTTRSLAVQLVLSLDERPDAATIDELDAIWARLGALEATLTEQGFAATQGLVSDVEADLVALLAPGSNILEDTTTTTAPPTTTASGSNPTTGAGMTTTTGGTSTTAPSGEPSTTTSAPTTSITSTTATEPPTTTTAPPGDP